MKKILQLLVLLFLPVLALAETQVNFFNLDVKSNITAKLFIGNGTGAYSGSYTGSSSNLTSYGNFTNFVGPFEIQTRQQLQAGVVIDAMPIIDSPTGSTTSNGFTFYISSTRTGGRGDYFSAFFNPLHGGYVTNYADVPSSEMQVTFGGNMALSPGYGVGVGRHIQFGIGGGHVNNTTVFNGSKNYWSYGQGCLPYSDAYYDSPGYSWAFTGKASVTAASIYYPGEIMQAWTNNYMGYGGKVELTFLRDLNVIVGAGSDIWNPDTVNRGGGVYMFTNSQLFGVDARGGLLLERTNVSTVSGTVVLDFGKSSSVTINAATNNITFVTTNSLGNSSNFEQRVFFIRATGFGITNIVYPAWTTLTNDGSVAETYPTAIPSGYIARLQLESYGPGETNKALISFKIGLDRSFYWDSDATSFIARASVSNLTYQAAINNFVVRLKAANLWTNWDIIYPFMGTNATSSGINLSTNSWNLTNSQWANAVFTNGVGFNGSSSYGNPGYVLNSAGIKYSLYSGTMVLYAGSSSTAQAYPIGAQNGTKYAGFRYTSGNTYVDGAINVTAGELFETAFPTDRLGTHIATRWSSATKASAAWVNTAYSGLVTNTTASALAVTPYIGARNSDGATDNYYSGNLRLVMIGGGINNRQVPLLQSIINDLATECSWPKH